MQKKRKSTVPRKPDGSIDWKAYDKQLVQKSMEKFDIRFIDSGDKMIVRMVQKKGGRHKRCLYGRKTKKKVCR